MRIGPMEIGTAQALSMALAVILCSAVVTAQQPAAPRPPVGRPVVDTAAHDRGRALWATHCVDCHGPQARGSDNGPNIIRTETLNYDRFAPQPGSVLGPFLKKGHPTSSKKPSASFTDAEIADLANFLRQRINDTMRGSPIFTVGDIVTGDPKAGETYFNGAGGCNKCHSPTGDLQGIASRYDGPTLQALIAFGTVGGGRGSAAAWRTARKATVTTVSGETVTGVLVRLTDFDVTIRDQAGKQMSWLRNADVPKVQVTDPLQGHIDLLAKYKDSDIHDLAAYLATLK